MCHHADILDRRRTDYLEFLGRHHGWLLLKPAMKRRMEMKSIRTNLTPPRIERIKED
jgi:uncharacterized C2H2 Zn-finger protein